MRTLLLIGLLALAGCDTYVPSVQPVRYRHNNKVYRIDVNMPVQKRFSINTPEQVSGLIRDLEGMTVDLKAVYKEMVEEDEY